MKQFVHQSLSQDDGIRILHLKPAMSFDAPLRCSLINSRLSDSMRYEALSYVWGTPTGDRRLICDKAELLITPNCELALRYLRFKWKSRSLWVDSICIDQNSTSDRNHQVKQMGKIYKMAANVLVWLGESDGRTKSAFARWTAPEQSNKPLEKLSSDDYEHLREICSMPWFRRVWTVQEVALATNCLILCGYESIPWEALVLAARMGVIRADGVTTLSARFRTLATRVSSRDYNNDRDLTKSSARVWLILTKCRREEASDPRDKIFGLFAILNGLGLTISTPDYSKTPATVYEELTVRFIQQFKHLGLLQLVFTFGRHPEVPTWVPDFNDRNFFIGVDTERRLPKTLVNSELLINRSPGQLPLRGKRISNITSRLHKGNFTFESLFDFRQSWDGGGYQYHLLLPWASVLREWISFVNQANCPFEGDATLLFSWLASKDHTQDAAETGAYVPICAKLIGNMVVSETEIIPRDELNMCRGFEGLPNTPDGVFVYLRMGDHYRLNLNEREWIGSCFDVICEQTLIVLSSGHIGRVSYSTEDTDIVVWFAGAHLPMVIRPVGENYIVIGPAYIHGLKENDVWEDEEDITELEIFTLL